ncbi:Vitamin K epoxide reductase family protein [Pseudobythopirellula maris]|uniref:Vitamin K epoxide reductase family protein n=1 Tax=Pseudobythopirellula maris TaxID=2527991 RepID=A0A5C5ZST8_9BACT|nr:vitamin K epoxide reductase family protein [Pseudobythopirellula maris]TWT90128.1 Vitamin K epoxide reductase family protein [Pseudobythopirellula maris]
MTNPSEPPQAAPAGIDPLLARDLNAPLKRFGYNPSAWSQRVPICVIAAVAAAIAAYMAFYQWRLISYAWDPIFGDQTQRVLDSQVSHRMRLWMLVPDAALGAFAYLGDAVFGLAGSTRRWQYRPWMVILFGIDVIPLGVVSAVLVVLQGTVVGSWCFLCLVTAVLSLVLIYFAYDEVWASLEYLYRLWRETHSWGEVWRATWGWPSETAERVAQTMLIPRSESPLE